MENLRPNSQRAKTAIVLIWIVLVINVLSLFSDIFQYNLLQDAEDGVSLTNEDITSNDNRQMVIGIVHILAYIVSCVTFIMWFRRAYFNLHQRTQNLDYTEGWAAGGWFVPVISLFYPYKIMRELYEETDKVLAKGLPGYTPATTTRYVGWWWALWIISNFLGQIVFRTTRNADTISELFVSTELSIIDALINIPLAFITMKVIKDCSDRETLLFEMLPPVSSNEAPSSVTVDAPSSKG